LLEVVKGNFRAFKGTVGAGEVIPVLTHGPVGAGTGRGSPWAEIFEFASANE
jgi:hypothetical protein